MTISPNYQVLKLPLGLVGHSITTPEGCGAHQNSCASLDSNGSGDSSTSRGACVVCLRR